MDLNGKLVPKVKKPFKASVRDADILWSCLSQKPTLSRRMFCNDSGNLFCVFHYNPVQRA